MKATIEGCAEWLRLRFDRATKKVRPVILVSILGALAGVAYWLVSYFAFRRCGALSFGFLDLGLTFSARTFTAMLGSAHDCRACVVRSLYTTDLLFPVCYAPFLCALYLWAERYRRFRPELRPPSVDGAALGRKTLARRPPATALSWLSSAIVILPFVAAVLDVAGENWPLWLAIRRLATRGDVPDHATGVLVVIGSFGAALKWSLIGVYLLGLVMMLFRGPRGQVLWRLRFSVGAVLAGSLAVLIVPQGQDILQRLVEGEHPYVRMVSAVLALTGAALVVWYSGRVLSLVRLTRDPARRDEAWMSYFENHIPRLLGVAVLGLAGTAFARAASVLIRFCLAVIVPYLLAIAVSRAKGRPLAVLGRQFVFPRALRSETEICDRVGRAALAIAAGSVIVWPRGHGSPDQHALRLAAWLSVTAAWALYLFIYLRRDLLSRPGSEGAKGRKEALRLQLTHGYDIDTLPVAPRIAVLGAVIVSAAAFAAFTLAPVGSGRFLGPLVVLALTTANAVFIGSVFAYLGRKARLPLVTMLFGLAVIFSRWNDNHAIRVVPSAPAPDTLHRGGELRSRFGTWLAVRAREDSGAIPVVLVAAAGGGLRAAYWSAVSLATLQDRDSMFARHVFAISGVSGGSLGAAVFTAMVRDLPGRPGSAPCLTITDTAAAAMGTSAAVRSSQASGPITACVRRFMGDDYLSPVLAKTVAPDFLQWFIPFPIRPFDRARALEQSWEDSYLTWVGDTTFSTAYLSLYGDSSLAVDTPLLLLNTTHVQTGRRYITAPFVDDGAFLDARSVHRALNADMRLSTAVHNSARFSYVSPAGRIDRRDAVSYGSLVDGGYFENSGLATLSDVRREIDAVLRPSGTPDPTLASAVRRASLVVLYLCNDPLACRRDRVADSSLAAKRGLAGEWLSPLLALLHTRDARGGLARATLARAQDTRFLQLNVCDSLNAPGEEKDSIARERTVNPPLGWQLSRLARDWMDASLVEGASNGYAGASDSSHTTGTSCRANNVAQLASIIGMLPVRRARAQR